MKIEKSLLILIAAAIAVTAIPACTKSQDGLTKKQKKQEDKKKEEAKPAYFNCPACGMG